LAVLAAAVAAAILQVDGLRNPLVQSLFLQDCPIHTAAFAAGGSKVVAAGRRPFYYIADLHTAQLERVVTPPSIHQQGQGSSTQQPLQQQRRKGGKGGKSSSGATGGRTGMKSCESFAASSDPARPLLAFLGDGGHIGLVNLGSRRPVGSLKMNGSARAAVFSSDGNTLITAGAQGIIACVQMACRFHG
jgi:U3 small nucleolar RNA-associated protein 18